MYAYFNTFIANKLIQTHTHLDEVLHTSNVDVLFPAFSRAVPAWLRGVQPAPGGGGGPQRSQSGRQRGRRSSGDGGRPQRD